MLIPRARESRVSPGQPVDGLMRGGFEIGRWLVTELIQGCASKYLIAVRVNNSAPMTSDSSSMSNVGL